jgi:hypothetical protein
MWTVPLHLSGSVCGIVTVLVVLGVSIRSVFRYPHIWRYLEFRLLARHDHKSGKPRCASDAAQGQVPADARPPSYPTSGRQTSLTKRSGNMPGTFLVLILYLEGDHASRAATREPATPNS